MVKIVDDRTEEENRTHSVIVLGTDRFLSGWGEAEGGASYAGWACKPDDFYVTERFVRRRSDMLRVRVVGNGYRPSARLCKHFHIYVVRDGHPAMV